MRVLIVSHYFWPESFRINDMAAELVAQGCEVTVLTGQPNYPDGEVFPGYRALSVRREQHPAGFEVVRVPSHPRGKGIRFVLVGSGSRLEWLKQQIQERGLVNVELPGRFPVTAMPGLFKQSSALIVSLVASPIMDQTIPSKVQAYMAAGRPVIASMNGEGARVVQESGAGVACPAGDATALAQAVSQLADLPPAALAEMGEAALRHYEQHFEPRMLSRRLIEMFRELR